MALAGADGDGARVHADVAQAPPRLPPLRRSARLVLEFARAGHEAGYPTEELEERVAALGHALGIDDVEISVTPTMLEVALGPLAHQQNYSFRVRPTAVNLGSITRLDALAREVSGAGLDPAAALERLREIRAQPLLRPWPVVLAAYGLAGAAIAPVLGGGRRELAAAAIVGLVVGVVLLLTRRRARAEPVVAPVAAAAAGFGAALLFKLGLSAAPDIVTTAALVPMLPGMALTIGIREISSQHLQSGVANTASALVQLFGLVFGIEIGRSIAASWFGPVPEVLPHAPFGGLHVVAAIAAGIGFTVTLRAQARDAWIMCSATVLALCANELGRELLGKDAGVLAAALAVGIVGGLGGGLLRRSPLVFIVPGVFMLVPGSAGLASALQLLTGQTVTGMTAAFDMFVTAGSIAYGLLVSTLVLPKRFARL